MKIPEPLRTPENPLRVTCLGLRVWAALTAFSVAGMLPIAAQTPTPTNPSAEKDSGGSGLKELQLFEKRYQEKLIEVQLPVIEKYIATLNKHKAALINEGLTAEAERIDMEIIWAKTRGWVRKREDLKDISRPTRLAPRPPEPPPGSKINPSPPGNPDLPSPPPRPEKPDKP